MDNYHPDAKVNQNCQRIIDELRNHPARINELAKSLNMSGYDVATALLELSNRGKVAKYALGHFCIVEQQ